jgi:hypothetical protein
LLGANIKVKIKKFELSMLRGEVLDVTLPPTIDDRDQRRPDLVEAIDLGYRFGKHKVATRYMRHTTDDQLNPGSNLKGHYFGLNYEGIIAKNFSIYTEGAKKLDSDIPVFSFSNDAGYGGYIGLNYTNLNFGFSAEYKNYHNFSLGTGINDPPTLVKEHSYRTLNRSTHVPVLNDESGYQFEAFYRTQSGGLFTFNTSLASNQIAEGNEPVFKEYFGEYQFYIKEKAFMKVFADYAQDPFVNEYHRYTSGSYVDLMHDKLTSTLEFEWQLINRDNGTETIFSNWYTSYTISKASKYSATILWLLHNC